MTAFFKLRSQISDLSLMRRWLDDLVQSNSINQTTAFSIRLALEEALSNIIRHGYNNRPGHNITIRFHQPSPSQYSLIIEDSAPRFSPFDAQPASPDPQSFTAGGLGLTLLHSYTTRLTHESLPAGNRLTLTFAQG